MTPSPDLFRLLDQLAANALPAQVQQLFGGWLLRASNGVTRRANSVLSAAPVPDDPNWLRHIEDFYIRRGLPPRFQVSDGSPGDLDSLLDSRGYYSEAITLVQIAGAREVIARSGDGKPVEVSTCDAPTEEWLDDFIRIEGMSESRKTTYRAIYNSIGPRACYLQAHAPNGATVGVGMSVTERGWSGLFSIATLPEYRGRGIATYLLRLLAERSLANDAPNLYLQVMENNENAVRLYENLSFSRLYSYHFRTRQSI